MIFRFMLWLLGLRLRWLAKHNEAFRKQLEQRNVIMQWRTFGGRPARWFHFDTNRVISAGGLHGQPTVALNFRDARYAFHTLLAARKSQMVFMEGMQKGDIRIEGDPAQLMWFMTLMKFIAPAKKK